METGIGQGSDASEQSKYTEGQSPFLLAIKREVEALEDRLLSRISCLEQQHLNFEAVLENLARSDTKLQDVEASQMKSEVTLAQLSGQMKAAMDQLESVQRCAVGTPRGTPAGTAAGALEVSGASAFGSGGVDIKKAMPKAGELTLPALGDQVARMSEKIEAHSDALAQVRKVLELQLLQQQQLQQQQQQQKQQELQQQEIEKEKQQEKEKQERKLELKDVRKPYLPSGHTLQEEMRVLAECIAHAEAAIKNLAPRLVEAAETAQRKPELLHAAKSLQAKVERTALHIMAELNQ